MSNINSIDKNLNEATNLFQLGNYHEAKSPQILRKRKRKFFN